MNKNKELIFIYKELEFIESYFFLLQIRHENKLMLSWMQKRRQGK